MELEEHLDAVSKRLHMISDARRLGKLQDRILSMAITCAHWRRTLEPQPEGYGLTAGHLAVTSKERIEARKRMMEGANIDVLEFSLSVRATDGHVTGAVCLTDPDIDASQFIGMLLTPPEKTEN